MRTRIEIGNADLKKSRRGSGIDLGGSRRMGYCAEGASATDLAMRVHLAISLATKRVNSSGDIFSVSIPSPARRVRSAGVAIAAAISALSRATISGGRPAGPEKPNQVVAMRSG